MKTTAFKRRPFHSPIRVRPPLPFRMEVGMSNNQTVVGHGAAIPACGSGMDAETGDAMLQHVWAEAKEGRMSEPVPATEMDLSSVLLHPRRADSCICFNSCMFHPAFVAGSLLSKQALMAARSCV